MSEKFIFAMNEEDRQNLLNNGFEEINPCQINGERVFVFINSQSSIMRFSENDKKRYIFSSVAFFV